MSVPDDLLLPLRERLRDWEDPGVAGFYLGKALGVIPPGDTFGKAKGLFYSGREDAMKLLGFLERRDPLGEYGEFRWRTGHDDADTRTIEDG